MVGAEGQIEHRDIKIIIKVKELLFDNFYGYLGILLYSSYNNNSFGITKVVCD